VDGGRHVAIVAGEQRRSNRYAPLCGRHNGDQAPGMGTKGIEMSGLEARRRWPRGQRDAIRLMATDAAGKAQARC